MLLLRYDARRDRRARVARPAPVAGPLTGGVALVLLVGIAGVLVGAPSALVLIAVIIVAGLVLLGVRRTVHNLAAGVLMRLVRPYCPGERIRLYVAGEGRVLEAEIVRIGAANTVLRSEHRDLVVPNTQLIHAA